MSEVLSPYEPALPGPLGKRLAYYQAYHRELDPSSLQVLRQSIRRGFQAQRFMYGAHQLNALRQVGEGQLAQALQAEAKLVATILAQDPE